VTKRYVVARGAADDLKAITRYTVEEWGEAQCRLYIAKLEQAAEALAEGDGVFREMGFVYPGLRMVLCDKHYIFCLPSPGALPLIVAILHERMDILRRLAARLL
jgi:plasmid stabilization system protein ParE